MEPFPLTRRNRIRLAAAFRGVPRVDLSLDCVIEDQMGQARVDDPDAPTVYEVQIGPFLYFAGDAGCAAARAVIRAVPDYIFIMPSAAGWLEAVREEHGERVREFDRYIFSPEELDPAHLTALLAGSPLGARVQRMDAAFLARCEDQPDFLEIDAYESGQDFLERSVGFTLLEGEEISGTAYGSLACSRGIEVSLFVGEAYRRQGVATALAAQLLLWCLENHMEPHWDAANPESCKLALKLGYRYRGSYLAHYLAG